MQVELSTILGLTVAVLGVIVVVLVAIAAVVLGPAVRRALAERRAGLDSVEGAEHGDGGRG